MKENDIMTDDEHSSKIMRGLVPNVDKDIWIVTEDKQLSKLMNKLLCKKGYNVKEFGSGGAVLEEMDDTIRKPHLIITDEFKEIGDIVFKANKIYVPTIVQTESSGIESLKLKLGTTVIKKPYQSNEAFLSVVEGELKKQELAANSAGSMDRYSGR